MSTQNTTLFDLNQTASAAAISAMGKDALSVESIKLESFTAAGHDREDFKQWEAYYTNSLTNYTNLQKTPSPAAKAALAAAASVAAKVATPATGNKTQAAVQAASTAATA